MISAFTRPETVPPTFSFAMNPSIVVLANLSEAAEKATQYAAGLAAPLHAHVTLLHCFASPVLMVPEMAALTAEQTDRDYAELAAGLQALAQRLPAPAEVVLSALPLADAVAEAVLKYQPLLLVMGLSPEPDFLDELLGSPVLPVLRASRYPLLLVPATALAGAVPHRVLLALDVEPYKLSATARKLAPLLATWPAAYFATHVLDGREPLSPHRLALGEVRASGVIPPTASLQLHQVSELTAVEGILQAVADTQADLVVLIARPRSFLGRRFHHSVTADVLRRSPVPVLLVPAEGAEVSD